MDMIDIFFRLVGTLPWWVQLIIALGVGLFSLLSTLRFVNEAEQGVRLRFGRVVRDRQGEPKILEPGFIFIIPVIENLRKHHTREQPLTLADQTIILKDRSVFRVGAAAYFRIHNVYRALFDIDNVELALSNFCMGVLRDELQKLEDVEGILDTEALSKKIYDEVHEKAEEWGIELTDFKIMNCAPSAETASYLNAGAAVKARHEALKKVGVTDPQMAAALLGAQTVNTVTAVSDTAMPVQITDEDDGDE